MIKCGIALNVCKGLVFINNEQISAEVFLESKTC